MNRASVFIRWPNSLKWGEQGVLFVRRELRLYSNANTTLRLRLVVIFSLVREELKAV